MGIENRDYVRNDDRRGPGGSFGAEYPAVRALILITVVVYLSQIFLTRPAEGPDFGFQESAVSVVQQIFQLDTQKVLGQGQVWRLVTSAFCHSRFDIWHILFNMLLLFWFGRELETIYGTRSFAWFYISAAIFSALAFIGLQLVTGETQPAIGASGAVMAVMMIYAIIHPRDRIYLFFVIPVQIRFLLLIYVAYDLHPVLLQLSGTPVATGVAHAAHLGGLFYGYVYWKTGFSLMSLWDKTPMAKSPKKSRRRNPDDQPRIIPFNGPFGKKTAEERRRENLDQEVDRILAKISDTGRESLTAKELRTLELASKKYNERPR